MEGEERRKRGGGIEGEKREVERKKERRGREVERRG